MSSLEVNYENIIEDKSYFHNESTIAAQATPTGFGGVGIVRVSGSKVLDIAQKILNFTPKPRYAHYADFLDNETLEIIDSGIAIYFKSPNSYTGEDILEFQCHGGPIVLNKLLNVITKLDVDLASPGDFSKRAYLNGKLDLAQVEAVADLIHAQSWAAAKAAVKSLSGEFSKKINFLLEKLIHIRVFIESQLDFSDEEIDFIDNKKALNNILDIKLQVETILKSAKQGAVLKEGINIVISGKPNAGKSSLLNILSGEEVAIVTDIAGTTRDILKKNIIVSGIPVNIIDTAGIRDSSDLVEKHGIERAKSEIKKADEIFLLIALDEFLSDLKENYNADLIYKNLQDRFKFIDINNHNNLTIIFNKVDLISDYKNLKKSLKDIESKYNIKTLFCSCSNNNNFGIESIKDHILKISGFDNNNTEGNFIARTRHVNALQKVLESINLAKSNLENSLGLELVAEELKYAQDNLSEITGVFTSDDLLGEIFSTFCIGK